MDNTYGHSSMQENCPRHNFIQVYPPLECRVGSSDGYGARLVLFLMLCMAGEAVAMAIAIPDVPGIELELRGFMVGPGT